MTDRDRAAIVMREIDVDKLMTLLTYTGLVLTLATIHEYVPYTPSLILSLILLRMVYKISRIILVLVYLEVLVFCLVLKLSCNLKFIPVFFMSIMVTNQIVCLIIVASITLCPVGISVIDLGGIIISIRHGFTRAYLFL